MSDTDNLINELQVGTKCPNLVGSLIDITWKPPIEAWRCYRVLGLYENDNEWLILESVEDPFRQAPDVVVGARKAKTNTVWVRFSDIDYFVTYEYIKSEKGTKTIG